MRMLSLFVVWLIFRALAATQDAPKAHVRFFNDSPKDASFYVDSHFGCSIPANPKENNAYCDAETAIGKHMVSVKGEKVRSQSCELYAIGRDGSDPGAEAHLSKDERLSCFSYAYDEGISFHGWRGFECN